MLVKCSLLKFCRLARITQRCDRLCSFTYRTLPSEFIKVVGSVILHLFVNQSKQAIRVYTHIFIQNNRKKQTRNMAKTRKDSGSTSRVANNSKNVEPSTPKTTKRSRSKSNALKKVMPTLADADVDSGISSPEKSKRTSKKDRSFAASTISKISRKSRSTISKTRNVSGKSL